MNKDRIFMKERYDGIVEKNATLGFGLYIVVYLVIFFGSIFLFAFLNVPGFLIGTWLIILSFCLIVLFIMANQSKNMSASTAFVERDGKLYAVQLLYTHKNLGTETSGDIIYMPAGTLLQAETLKNNFEVASDVQAHEKEVRERRKIPASFSIALDDILSHLEKHPKQYRILPISKRSKLDNLFMYNVENAGMCIIMTKNANYNFLILNNPTIAKKTKKIFVINYYNEKNELCSAKFTNCFDKLIEYIENDIGNQNGNVI